MSDRPSAVSGVLRRPFPEQLAYFRGKLHDLVPTARWDDLTAEAHDTAFMVAGAQKADLLSDLAASVDRAILAGKSLDAFREEFQAAVDRHDWHGWTGEDTKGGRAWRTRTIYRTNTAVSYAAGRRAQLEAGDFPWWLYRHGGSKDPRPEHLGWNGLVLAADDPAWAWLYPPSDWGCSCYVVGARTRAGAKRLGGDPDKQRPANFGAIDPATGEPIGVGKGWGYAPGARVAAGINDKLRYWDGPIAEAFLDDLPASLRARIAGVAPEAPPPPGAITSVMDLTPIERAALVSYTGAGYQDINGPLRESGYLTPDAHTIADVLERCHFPETATVYRGIGGTAAELLRDSDLEAGDVIRDVAFTSCSRSSGISRSFAEQHEHIRGVLIRVFLPKGAKALDVVTISQHPMEQEVLVQRNVAMRVIRWDDAGVLEVEVVGDE